MFAAKLSLAALSLLSAVYVVSASPTGLSPREDRLPTELKLMTPAELDPSNVTKPTPGKPAAAAVRGGVKFCTDANFQGRCVYVSKFNSGQCVGVGSDYNDNVTSFRPDAGLTCTIYSDAGCKGRATGGVVAPGINNLADYNNNDAMSSFKCTQ